MTTSQILVAARARLTPETWGKGHNGDCLMRALGQIVDRPTMTHAYSLLLTCTFGHFHGSLYKWNDAPERTLADVHALFDAAIAIAQEQEAVHPILQEAR